MGLQLLKYMEWSLNKGYKKNSITAIVNVYARTQYFEEQLDAILNQTVIPQEIIIWVNYCKENEKFVKSKMELIVKSKKHDAIRIIQSNHNWKYHGRFAGALLAQSEYVCVFDDDTIPGKGWFENCLKSMRIKNGMMGAVGEIYQILNSDNNEWQYTHYKVIGWKEEEEYSGITQVDVIGHSWFFRKEWIKYFWMEEPVSWDIAEDIQFAYCLQKYGNINCYVPPQPNGNDFLCGSLKGYEYGNDEVASHVVNKDKWRTIGGVRNLSYYEYIVDRDFKLLCYHPHFPKNVFNRGGTIANSF
jgi:hypothetical protein